MPDDQSRTVAFLSTPAAFPGAPPDAGVEVVETHGARVFLCGEAALKLKRAVTYDYMDLGTAELRHRLLERELQLNRPAAPEIYRAVLPVTEGPEGPELDGQGATLDWVLSMRRFPAEDELTAVADRGGLDDRLADATGRELSGYHHRAETRDAKGSVLIRDILDELGRVFGEFEGAPGTGDVGAFLGHARDTLTRVAPLLDERSSTGHVRRGHGDLHLRNLVLLDGRPVPFDALEFDEALGTCDLLYDLAFLLMDLCHRDLARPACRVLDAWLLGFGGTEDAGLQALPLFLSVRAAIRAMVQLQTDAARHHEGEGSGDCALYLSQAVRFLTPPPPRLLAVGGFSGSGKSVLARSLTPGLGAAPGAVLLSSDLTRKAGEASVHLAEGAYAPEKRGAVYETLLDRARVILRAGHSALLDATFLDPSRCAAAGEVADSVGVPFAGLWLDAPVEVLEDRIRQRHGDASDADVAVLHKQIDGGARRPEGWHRVDASGTPDEVLAAARQVLAEI